MECEKCGSENITVQELVTTQKKKKGLLYWVFIGWWLETIMWLFLTLPWLIIKIFKPKKYKDKITKKAICQNCGNSWEIQ